MSVLMWFLLGLAPIEIPQHFIGTSNWNGLSIFTLPRKWKGLFSYTGGMPAHEQSTSDAPALRRDAERNRDRILVAARQAYAHEGLHVSMASVARRADVGVATLFRRFPTQQDLIAAVFGDTMDSYVSAVTTALEETDPWQGFERFIRTVCGMQAADRGFAEVLTMTFPAAEELEAKRSAALRGVTQLIGRAQQAGQLRATFCPEDLVVLLMANAGVVAAAGDHAPGAWERLVGHLLQAFAVHEVGTPPPAPEPDELHQAMRRLAADPP